MAGQETAAMPDRKPPPPSTPPAELDQCRRCDLWRHATQAVGGAGPARAHLMLVGEQPGDQEDLAGQPFVGPAGHLLDALLEEAGVDRAGVYVTNAVKHFKWEPRGKRRLHKTPAQQEIDACRYWLDAELARVRPRVVVALGVTALKAVTGDPHGALRQVMGQPFRHQGRWIVAVYHPSFVLRVPGEQAKRDARAQVVAGLREAARLLHTPPQP
jgi:DNA polymerase